MNDFKSQYYIVNVPWQRNLNYDDITRFNIKYSDVIVFHFDFIASVFKVNRQKYTGYNRNIFISAINVCLRYRQIIKKLYPYNEVSVIIHLKNKANVALDLETFKTVLNLIPNFAVCDDTSDTYFDFNNYKHIFYGYCSNYYNKIITADKQLWSTVMGRLIIK